MQLADDDLYRIISIYPSIKESVQQIIDADMYWIEAEAKKEAQKRSQKHTQKEAQKM